MGEKQIQVNCGTVTVVLVNAPDTTRMVPVGLALKSNKCPRGPSDRIHSQPGGCMCVCVEGGGGGGWQERTAGSVE